jgi:predicted lipoprotein with Yx(FWY)xxD motif
MKKTWIWIIVVVVIIAAVGYAGRHKIKSMLGMNPALPPAHMAVMHKSNSMMQTIIMANADKNGQKYLTDAKDMTLYVYDNDSAGVSNCSGDCIKNWPAFSPGNSAPVSLSSKLTVFTRPDGTKQYAWKNKPLYYFVKDIKPGEATGDGVGGTWHVARP